MSSTKVKFSSRCVTPMTGSVHFTTRGSLLPRSQTDDGLAVLRLAFGKMTLYTDYVMKDQVETLIMTLVGGVSAPTEWLVE